MSDSNVRVHLSMTFALLMIGTAILTAAELFYCKKSIIPTIAFGATGAGTIIMSMAGIITNACLQMADAETQKPTLILLILAAAGAAGAAVLGIVGLCI